MKHLVGVLVCAVALGAQDFSLERLFSRPFIWGTPPSDMVWAQKASTLAFLWNAEGRRFKDLYAYHAGQQSPVRLTNLEAQKEDDLNLSEAEKDDRLRRYLLPHAGIASFDVSQDGTRLAFAYKGDLYVVDADGKSPPLRLTRTKASESEPRLSPDGKLLASLRGRQIHVQDLTTGQIWQITDVEGGAIETYAWSPDGGSIFYEVRKGAGRLMPLPLYSGQFVSARTFERTVAGDDMREFSLYLVSSRGGKPTLLDAAATKGYLDFRKWSPDSRKLLFILITPDWKKKQIVVIDAKTAKSAVVAEESDAAWVDYGFAGWSPDSQWVLYTAERDKFAHLYKVPAAGGSSTQLTRGEWETRREPFTHDPQWIGDAIYYTSTEGGTAERHTFRIRPDGAGKQKLSRREGLNSGLVSGDGKHIAWLLADLKNPLDIWVGDRRITQSPRPEFYQAAWPETRFVSWPSPFDQKPVAAKLLLPPGYKLDERTKKLWPAVFFIHGAGIATSVLKQWGSYNDLRFAYNTYLAGRGYVVVDLDYRGSTGYGRDWRTGVYLDMGGPDLDDVLGGVGYLRSLGNIDMNRIGIWGVSYGGFMTNMALFRAPGVFKAGSSWAAVNDWQNYNGQYTPQRLNAPAANPEAYRRSSPIWYSNNLRDRLLIIHGMVDDNVLFQDSVQLTEKLVHEGKDFAHRFYPQENHSFVRDETWIDALRRTTEWFERWLQ